MLISFLFFFRDQEKNVFVDPIRSMANAHPKQEPDRSRTPNNKELHRFYMESPHSKQQLPPRMPQGGPDRISKFKEENRCIIRESIEMAPFTARICAGETERESYSRISSQPKSHEKEVEHSLADMYKYKHSVSQSLPQTNYFTTLSNSVVNEPPRLFQSKDLNPYFDKAPAASSSLSLGSYNSSHTKSLSKPPPLIKHQPEGEGLVGKITEQLSQQAPIHSLSTSVVMVSERCSPAISPSSQPKGMPALRRAPVFHPPTQQALDRKEGAYGRLSPPTLTPIQPVSSAGKVSEQQKPPTLLPELRDEKSGAELGSAESCRPGREAKSHEKVAWHSENTQGKPQAAMASVIVRPSTCIKYDGSPGSKMAPKEQLGSRLLLAALRQTAWKWPRVGNLGESSYQTRIWKIPAIITTKTWLERHWVSFPVQWQLLLILCVTLGLMKPLLLPAARLARRATMEQICHSPSLALVGVADWKALLPKAALPLLLSRRRAAREPPHLVCSLRLAPLAPHRPTRGTSFTWRRPKQLWLRLSLVAPVAPQRVKAVASDPLRTRPPLPRIIPRPTILPAKPARCPMDSQHRCASLTITSSRKPGSRDTRRRTKTQTNLKKGWMPFLS